MRKLQLRHRSFPDHTTNSIGLMTLPDEEKGGLFTLSSRAEIYLELDANGLRELINELVIHWESLAQLKVRLEANTLKIVKTT